VPFTVFMVVALINALNMADGVDGLTGVVVLAALSMFAAAGLYAGDAALVAVIAAVAGAVLGFLVFNLRRPGLPRARVFLGNGGSALLGLVIAWASLRLSQNPAHPVTAILLPWLLVPPVVDAVALVIRRALQGRSPFAADRNHMHHLMLDAGFRPSLVALSLGAVTLLCGGTAAVALREDWVDHTALVLMYVAITIAWFLLTWRRERAVAAFARLHRLLTIWTRSTTRLALDRRLEAEQSRG
jgi:UDP-GlcNAc:undecaprenyl-phosphate GlcNAc-1-phosphate transferase